MTTKLRQTAFGAAALLTILACGAAAAAEFIVPVEDTDQAWVYAPDQVAVDGNRRKSELYEVWSQGRGMDGRKARIVDTLTEFNCETLEFRPLWVIFLDEKGEPLARGKVDEDPAWIATTPDSHYGQAAAAVCRPETVAAGAHRQATDLKAAALALIAAYDK